MLENDQAGLVQGPLHICSDWKSAFQTISHREGDQTRLSVVSCPFQFGDGSTVDGDEIGKEAWPQC